MDDSLYTWISSLHWFPLILVFTASMAVLGYSADKLVDLAVTLSVQSGLPRVIIGATIVSLGTTMPEAAVSVYAAFNGDPGMALGNAVGSIICDTGLILGLSCILLPLPIDRHLVNRQGWIQVGAGVLLVLSCVSWSNPAGVFAGDGTGVLPQAMGWFFIVLLGLYMAWSVWIARSLGGPLEKPDEEESPDPKRHAMVIAALVLLACGLLVASSMVLIQTARVSAELLSVPPGVIAATIVAFGTSLPELVTAMTAVRKKKGEIALGNVIGADILNVLFVAGASASVTAGGLTARPYFFRLQFPAMLLVLFTFRIGLATSRKGTLGRPVGIVLLGIYIAYLVLNVLS
jgi:cation:H+ antiporter